MPFKFIMDQMCCLVTTCLSSLINGCLKKPTSNQLWGSIVHINRRKAD